MALRLDDGPLHLDRRGARPAEGERPLALELARDVLRDDYPQLRAHRAVLEHRHGDCTHFLRNARGPAVVGAAAKGQRGEGKG